MGGHDHHHHELPYKIPDYRIYKVEDVPELVRTRDILAQRGLKDPWLRNEVWRYDKRLSFTEKANIKLVFSRGFKWGFGAFVLTAVASAIYDQLNPSEHGHGHH